VLNGNVRAKTALKDGRCFSPVSNFHAAKRTHGASDVVNHGAVVRAMKTHPSGDFTRRPMQPRLTIAASLSPSLHRGVSVWWVVVNIPVTFCCCGDAVCHLDTQHKPNTTRATARQQLRGLHKKIARCERRTSALRVLCGQPGEFGWGLSGLSFDIFVRRFVLVETLNGTTHTTNSQRITSTKQYHAIVKRACLAIL
jgi:hypothetical protein